MSKYQKVTTRYETATLMKSLYKHLVKNHPIHGFLKSLSLAQVKSIHSECGMKLFQTRQSKSVYERAVAHYFFLKYGESPLTNLEKVLIEKGINIVTEQQHQGTKRKARQQLQY